MNPIASFNAHSIQSRINGSQQRLNCYDTLKKIARVAIPLFSFFLLALLSYFKPRSLPISSTVLLLAYAPCMEVTVGTFDRWSSEVRIEIGKLSRIQEELSSGKTIFQAWLDAIPETPLPTVNEQEQEVVENPGAEDKRVNLWEAQKARAFHRLEMGRRKVERAFIVHLRDHPQDLRNLSDFGNYQLWHIEYLINDLPFTVFVRKDGQGFTNQDNCSGIFT